MKNSLLLLIAIAMLSFKTDNKTKRIIFFGDSITQAGVQPGGYIVQMQEYLGQSGTSDQFELLGAGIGGNKVYDLYLRMEEDVMAKNPDMVCIWVGVNDVWHKRSFGTGTDADKFRGFYAAMIKKMQAQHIQLILCTPACIGEKYDCSNTQDGEINQYANIIRDLAREFNCKLCDFRQAFMAYEAEHNTQNAEKGILTTDGVHLNEAGNKMVANMLLDKIK
ncbi:MAG: G-D-S-L family lipolytic protein [Lewinellaceae bacterium]|nr:G-D-S-L family lipolytic protein [Lewinellaceae bacterium]